MMDAPKQNNLNGAVQGVRSDFDSNSPFNALSFMINNAIKGGINTAIPVKVISVSNGYVSALPMVCQTDAQGNTVTPSVIPQLPYHRYQGGRAAVIIDPVPGDLGLAVFAQKDVSNVKKGTNEPQQPGSYRNFDMSDGFYFGGQLNGQPEVLLELKQDGTAILTARNGVTINGDVTVNGDVTAKGISLCRHVHGGCQGGSTSSPS